MFDSPAARIRQIKIAAPEKITECCSRGVISLFRKTVDTPTRMLPNGAPFSCNGICTS